jgi:hypothetical protein
LHDAELKVSPETDTFTVAELIERLTDVVFAELDSLEDGNYSNRSPAVSSLRRNLQRNYLQVLSNLALGRTSSPQDCQAIAYLQLGKLHEKMEKGKRQAGLDSYTLAHLTASADRIQKVLEASMVLGAP